MTEQKECGTCHYWEVVATGDVGVIDCGGNFLNNGEIKTGWCDKKKEPKSANETCKDWESK